MTDEHFERPLLDTIRWLSAFIVALGHALGLILSKDDPSPLMNFVYYISDLRHPCVILFFVLSGYLVGGGVLKRSKNIDFKQYFAARFSRIYIVLIPAILLTLILDGSAFIIDRRSPVYNEVWPSGVLGGTPLFARYNSENFVATILSLENLIGDPIGSAAPLWSLGYEWIFYFTFPAIIIATSKYDIKFRYAAFGAAIVGLVLAGRAYFAAFFCIWLFGACASYLAKSGKVPKLIQRTALLAAIATFILTPLIPQRIADPALGIFFAAYLSRFTPTQERGINYNIDKKLAGFSYSLYVTHLPVMVFFTFIASHYFSMPSSGLGISITSITMIFSMMAASIFISYAFGQVFENRTEHLKRLVIKNMSHNKGQ